MTRESLALIRQFHDGTARKDWEAWGLEMIAALRSAESATATRSDPMLDGAEAAGPDEKAPSTPVAAKQGQQ